MKQLMSKIFSTVLALLVLFSTFSFTVDKHYCGDFLVDISYLGEASSCNGLEQDDCESTEKKDKCCKNEVHQIDGQDEIQKVSSEKIVFKKAKLFVAFLMSYKLIFQEEEKQFIPHQYYSPPDLVFDIQVLHEVFII
ncbi:MULTISPECIES: HYC_CC_PP family protein [unclassified Tenacibaculum]|uniref:HYC_CC_PP family protein n=1 Tax=unclassified Tenacibaculum TaxID=2635139 RepID=UPI001F39E958|nr:MULTISPECIES: hypothetical protein [unclassified Tenacibaculum]MCF2875311.1 hypothetical protein [Tenacibaculum sp. Cn5-1]MCF2935387.1 hypothetical protein [Tenacibaculum sp. Cn5-34]MCG7511947.1 hypothetical protein [Tenacibaculum sp. Cn5-46]